MGSYSERSGVRSQGLGKIPAPPYSLRTCVTTPSFRSTTVHAVVDLVEDDPSTRKTDPDDFRVSVLHHFQVAEPSGRSIRSVGAPKLSINWPPVVSPALIERTSAAASEVPVAVWLDRERIRHPGSNAATSRHPAMTGTTLARWVFVDPTTVDSLIGLDHSNDRRTYPGVLPTTEPETRMEGRTPA